MVGQKVASRIGDWIRQFRPENVDLTGGAPELSEFFHFFVETARRVGSHVIDRCNLTIIEEAGYEDLPMYLAGHEVEVIASLPCYTAENVTKQRGAGAFEKSISALRKLNGVGYGTRLPLNLVYNPVGPKLPAPQAELEADYLRRQGQAEAYMSLLANSFNPATVESLMCRATLSVGWMGEVYDCDFNQMAGMQMHNGKPLYLWDVTPELLEGWAIRTGEHCLACTAGCGSSCGGALQTATAS